MPFVRGDFPSSNGGVEGIIISEGITEITLSGTFYRVL